MLNHNVRQIKNFELTRKLRRIFYSKEDKDDMEHLGNMEAMKKSEDLRNREDTGNAKAIEETWRSLKTCSFVDLGGGVVDK